MEISKSTLLELHDKIRPFIHRTAVLTSELLNEISGTELYFKCENFQKTGAFKMRGASSAILNLTEEQLAQGVITHSSGNFAQAVALAAKKMGIKAYIVMPSSAPKVKQRAVINYGGEVTICPPTIEDREATSNKIIEHTQANFLHPSNDIHVILGQATAAIELLEEQPDLDYVLVPVGGGGLLAGTSLAVHFFANDCVTLGTEPMEADDAYHSLLNGRIEKNKTADTIADGLRTHLGDINFPIIQEHVQAILRVDEENIIAAMRLIWERMKILIEPSSAVPFAAVLTHKDLFENKKVGIILSGGNVELSNLPF